MTDSQNKYEKMCFFQKKRKQTDKNVGLLFGLSCNQSKTAALIFLISYASSSVPVWRPNAVYPTK